MTKSQHDNFIKRLEKHVYDYTYADYSNTYSSGDYSDDMNIAKIKINELIEVAKILFIDLPDEVVGYIGLTYTINPQDDD